MVFVAIDLPNYFMSSVAQEEISAFLVRSNSVLPHRTDLKLPHLNSYPDVLADIFPHQILQRPHRSP